MARGRLVCWELAVLTLLAVLDAPWPLKIVALTTAAILVAATVLRVRDRLLCEWFARTARFLLHRRAAELRPGEHAASDLAQHLAGPVQLESVEVDGMPAAYVRRPEGVAAVLELFHPDDGSWADVLAPESLLPPPDADAVPFAVHVVMQGAAPEPGVLAGPAGQPRRLWVTLQAVRTAELPDDDALRTTLANSVHRLVRRLRRADVPTRPLDITQVLALITSLTSLDDATRPIPVRERWDRWQAGALVHACFRIDWSDADPANRRLALRRLQLVPSRGTTIAITARQLPGPGEFGDDRHAIVRISADDHRWLANSADLLAFALHDLSPTIGLERLDGAHHGAVAASLPLGVGVLA